MTIATPSSMKWFLMMAAGLLVLGKLAKANTPEGLDCDPLKPECIERVMKMDLDHKDLPWINKMRQMLERRLKEGFVGPDSPNSVEQLENELEPELREKGQWRRYQSILEILKSIDQPRASSSPNHEN